MSNIIDDINSFAPKVPSHGSLLHKGVIAEAKLDAVTPRPIISAKTARNYKYADWQFEKLVEQIEEFESGLNENLDIMVQLASFGRSVNMLVEKIGYQNPSLIYFWGTVNGYKAQLIQNINQLSFLLLSVQKPDPTRPAHRIGFAIPENGHETSCGFDK